MSGETIGGYKPVEKAFASSDRVDLDAVMGHMEVAVEAGLNPDMVVRQGLSTLIRADLKNY